MSNHNSILDTLQQMKTLPSIIFISETRVKDTDTDHQLSQIIIPGFTLVLNNSLTNAGGTAIYVSELISYSERTDINFVNGCSIPIEQRREHSLYNSSVCG